jgi:hypothetical protein
MAVLITWDSMNRTAFDVWEVGRLLYKWGYIMKGVILGPRRRRRDGLIFWYNGVPRHVYFKNKALKSSAVFTHSLHTF